MTGHLPSPLPPSQTTRPEIDDGRGSGPSVDWVQITNLMFSGKFLLNAFCDKLLRHPFNGLFSRTAWVSR